MAMMNIKDLLDSVAKVYRDIPGVMDAMQGEEEAIDIFIPNRPSKPNYITQLEAMAFPSILVSHTGTELGFRGTITQWRHTIRLDVKLSDDMDYFTLLNFLIDGIPENGDGLSVLQCSFDDRVDSMEEPVWSRQVTGDGKDFYRLEFALQERGGAG